MIGYRALSTGSPSVGNCAMSPSNFGRRRRVQIGYQAPTEKKKMVASTQNQGCSGFSLIK